MMDKEETVSACRLCLEYPETTFVELTENIKVITKTVIPELDMELCRKPILCSDCCLCLNELYVFKTTCFVNETHIQHKLINFRSKTLREILGCTKIEKIQIQQPSICRLCFKEDSNKYFSVKPHVADENLRQIITKCLPEINLKLTDDPKICRKCSETLHNFYHFKTTCLEVENTLLYCRKSWKVHRKNLNVNKVLEYHIQKVKEKQKLEQLNQPEEREICIIESVVSLKEKDQEEIIEVNDDDDCCPDLSNDVYITIGDAEEKTETSDISYSKFEADEEKLEAEEEAVVESKSSENQKEQIYNCQECDFETKDKKLIKEHQARTAHFKIYSELNVHVYVTERNQDFSNNVDDNRKRVSEQSYETNEKKILSNPMTNLRNESENPKGVRVQLYQLTENMMAPESLAACGICYKLFETFRELKSHMTASHFISVDSWARLHICNKFLAKVPSIRIWFNALRTANRDTFEEWVEKNVTLVFIWHKRQRNKFTLLGRTVRNLYRLKTAPTCDLLRKDIFECHYLICGICKEIFAEANEIKKHFYEMHTNGEDFMLTVAPLFQKARIFDELKDIAEQRRLFWLLRYDYTIILTPVPYNEVLERNLESNDDTMKIIQTTGQSKNVCFDTVLEPKDNKQLDETKLNITEVPHYNVWRQKLKSLLEKKKVGRPRKNTVTEDTCDNDVSLKLNSVNKKAAGGPIKKKIGRPKRINIAENSYFNDTPMNLCPVKLKKKHGRPKKINATQLQSANSLTRALILPLKLKPLNRKGGPGRPKKKKIGRPKRINIVENSYFNDIPLTLSPVQLKKRGRPKKIKATKLQSENRVLIVYANKLDLSRLERFKTVDSLGNVSYNMRQYYDSDNIVPGTSTENSSSKLKSYNKTRVEICESEEIRERKRLKIENNVAYKLVSEKKINVNHFDILNIPAMMELMETYDDIS